MTTVLMMGQSSQSQDTLSSFPKGCTLSWHTRVGLLWVMPSTYKPWIWWNLLLVEVLKDHPSSCKRGEISRLDSVGLGGPYRSYSEFDLLGLLCTSRHAWEKSFSSINKGLPNSWNLTSPSPFSPPFYPFSYSTRYPSSTFGNMGWFIMSPYLINLFDCLDTKNLSIKNRKKERFCGNKGSVCLNRYNRTRLKPYIDLTFFFLRYKYKDLKVLSKNS